jgi:hypothetical protein
VADINKFIATPKPDPVNRPSRLHPTGWEPGVDTAKGVIVAPPTADAQPPNDWTEILHELKLDPDRWQVDSDTVNVRTWDTNVGDGQIVRLFYYKAEVRPRHTETDVDIDLLMRRISKHRYRRQTKTATDRGMVVCLADWQAGPDPEGLVAEVLRLKDRVVDRLKTERPSMLYVVGMGDLVESCDGHYQMQTFATGAGGLNGRRDQIKLVRRLLVELVSEWSRHVDRLVLSSVPGNHGENRRSGKAFTTFEDNDDLAVVEQVGEILSANVDVYGHVRTVIPDGDMALVLDVCGTVVAFAHGHQARKGSTPQQKMLNWWKDKAHAQHPVGDASVLCTAHYHHAQLHEDGPRVWMQCPAMAQSRWWEEGGGPRTATGTLTFMVGPDGWDRSLSLL